jgi:hypothetical protein
MPPLGPSILSRRRFLAASSTLAALGVAGGSSLLAAPPEAAASTPMPSAAPPATAFPALFPTQAPELVREVVGVSHFDLARVRTLVGRHPSLARATWDWGFGDWESALGAASHVGNRPIAEYLIAMGARPDLFTAAMLGHLDVVKAFVASSPGVQRIKGPHGITLLSHAKAGGDASKPVVAYLESLGDADQRLKLEPLSDAQTTALLGRYRYGAGDADVFVVEKPKDLLQIRRADQSLRNVFHLGDLAFYPAGAEAVRFRFSTETPAKSFTLHDPDLVLTAEREAT